MKMLQALLAVAMLAAPAGAGPRLKVHVSHTQMEDILVQVIVEPSAENRELEVTADSDDFYRSTRIPLDGEDAPRVSSVSFSQVPPGYYRVRVRVLAAGDREVARVVEPINIF